jgi:DNA replication protein DnaC
MTDFSADVVMLLRALKLQAMADIFSDLALRAARENYTYEAFLYELALQETRHRTQGRIARRIRESGLPPSKTFQSLQLNVFDSLTQHQLELLRTGDFIADAINVIIVGSPGAGKSHVAAALGYELIRLGLPVLWSSTTNLIQRLLAAKRDLWLPREMSRLDRFECLILDNIGYIHYSQEEMEILFMLLSDCYERRSVIITTNLMLSDWRQIFKTPMTTLAAIDRVTRHSVLLDLRNLESYRPTEGME